MNDEGHDALDVPLIVVRDPEDDLAPVLREAQKLLLLHPLAAQAGFGALMAEGRSFAGTPEGQAWKERLEGSELVERVATLWENATLNVLEERSATLLPSRLLDVVVMAAGLAPLDRFLGDLLRQDTGAPEEAD